MNEDKIIEKLIGHDSQFDQIRHKIEDLPTKEDYRKQTDLLENIVTIVKKSEDDRVFIVELFKRLQDKVDRQEEEIKKIKLQLHLV